MIRELWFPTPIWYDYISFDKDKIIQDCYRMKEINPVGNKLSNVGGWQSKNILDLPQFKDFFVAVNNKCEEVYAEIAPNFKGHITNAWININGPNCYNKLHYHARCTFSGCVYLNVEEESGDIAFNTPTLQEHYPFYVTDNPMFYLKVKYKPENYKMLLFPAWVSHEVLPSPNAKGDRISISFNILCD
jgi:uncharacterized protein (TIGR02466 family)